MKEKGLRLLLSLALAVMLYAACTAPVSAEEAEGDDAAEQLHVVLDSAGAKLFTFCCALH